MREGGRRTRRRFSAGGQVRPTIFSGDAGLGARQAPGGVERASHGAYRKTRRERTGDGRIGSPRAGRGGRIRAKLNGLADAAVIGALYRAAQAGVTVDLVVRGICMLRPGVPGLSERVRVVSVLGRFLEHARVYHFGNGGSDEYLIGLADWRPRNLRRRVEVVTPVATPALTARLDTLLADILGEPSAWVLGPDGTYVRSARPSPGAPHLHERLLR